MDRSRARLAAAADAERRRIERDLHDGAQQRLIALRVRLQLAEETIGHDPVAGMALLHELGPEVDAVIDEVRSLSRGIYPPLLTDAGPVEALKATALHSPLEVTVTDHVADRHRSEIESAVYFCCLEAIQNAIKHARGATEIQVSVEDGEWLSFEVHDDGAGFGGGGGSAGAGLTNMRDRLAAVAGELVVSSAPGAGTTVSGMIPLT
jgi:signal transduction histidine kinase